MLFLLFSSFNLSCYPAVGRVRRDQAVHVPGILGGGKKRNEVGGMEEHEKKGSNCKIN